MKRRYTWAWSELQPVAHVTSLLSDVQHVVLQRVSFGARNQTCVQVHGSLSRTICPVFHHFLICENTLCAVGADTIQNRLPRGIFLCVCYCYNVSTISAPCGNILLVLCIIICEIGFALCNICRRPQKVNNVTQSQNPTVGYCQAFH